LAGFVGVNPADLTCRELWWMAEGKRMAVFDCIAHVKAWAIASLTGKPVAEPWKLNPFRVPQTPKPRPKTEEEKAKDNELGWAAMDQFFTGGDARWR
jgi:hypothetical protein